MLRVAIAVLLTFAAVTVLVTWWGYENDIFARISCNGECYFIPLLEPTVRLGVIAGGIAAAAVLVLWALGRALRKG